MNIHWANDAADYDDYDSAASAYRSGNEQPKRRSNTHSAMGRNAKFGHRRNGSGQKGIHRRRVRKIQW